ncbi:Phosphatase tensin-type domain-containing protein [Meloidogyne graminicola]|uniref:Phosphatase tensin-type domain-containing protein n=1 Tax=Meloidogyne graminicola TaxID=189291 RepID=A0A8S9ZBJ4_9BILA|nr:Phosphatase tensin-type domain-containing protein [Meloidogyne graminicola]
MHDHNPCSSTAASASTSSAQLNSQKIYSPSNQNRKNQTDSIIPSASSNQSTTCVFSVDSISDIGTENRLLDCCYDDGDSLQMEQTSCNSSKSLQHFGSSSTTFSTSSSNITSGSYPINQCSEASSSGVATLDSSADRFLLTNFLPNSIPNDNSTPTMNILTELIISILREMIHLSYGTTSTVYSTESGTEAIVPSTTITAFSSLSLNSAESGRKFLCGGKPAGISAKILSRSTKEGEDSASPNFLAHQGQAHSTPSLLSSSFADACAGPNQAKSASTVPLITNNQKGQQNDGTPSAVVANTSSDSTTLETSSSNSSHSIIGSNQLPSVLNCAATSCSQMICTPLRTIVSQNRRRYQMDGFNLDLTYITDRIIAMGYPAETKEALYRNSMSHIVKFLEHYHPGHYKVFNLRGQYVYDPANFHNRVISFEMTDHHPPRLELMAPFCREVHEYLEADPLNVVAVHCKAGKGRTGVMICAYLCYISFYRIPRQNMDYYSIIRTHNNKGVTIPSQRRYVYYFAHLRERKLNYIPLRCELIGVYLERPPKLSGTFSKGALKVRVASGDVDVFLGNDMWINSEQYEEEEELYKRFPLTCVDEEQQIDDCDNDCISRRCYGWTVPSNKRVFLEGDIRIDIFQKSRLKLFNVKQERKKVGHIWFNTMFTCPGFCGGRYVHGDEAYSYPDSMIVRRCFKRIDQKHFNNKNTEPDTFTHNGSKKQSMVDDSSISTFSNDETKNTNDEKKNEERQKSRSMRFVGRLANEGGISGTAKKRWQSQDGFTTSIEFLQHTSAPTRKQCRSSLDTIQNDYEEEIIVEKPPGLDNHCSSESLRGIYPNEKLAPRYGIEEIIRDAFHKNLIKDLYNNRRMSQPREGPLVPKAAVDRPNASGPFCLMRRSDEHVSVFGVQEIDRAYKNKDIDLSFKVFVVTRCIDESISSDVRLAEQFIRVTNQKQAHKDIEKLEKMQQKHKKLILAQQQHLQNSNKITGGENSDSCLASSSTDSEMPCSSTESNETLSLSRQQKQFNDDPRFNDPHFRKYFFRQRVTSQSRHPNVHQHCSLRFPDPKICAKLGCAGSKKII